MNKCELGKRLEEIIQEIKELKKKKREINRYYVPYVKNPLMGYTALWGTRALRNLPYCKDSWRDHYRDKFFEDIKFKSKLSKINKKISLLEDEYQTILAQIKILE